MPALAHLGIGFVTKRFAPQVPLWALLLSSMVLDLLSVIFLFALWITHGLFMSVMWSIFAMVITFLFTKQINSKKGLNIKNSVILQISILIALIIISYWILDFIGWPISVIDSTATGVPLLFDDSVNIGLGVYSTWIGALLMDIGVFIVVLIIYLHYVKRIKNK